MKKRILAFNVAVMTLSVVAACAIVLPKSARADEITPPDVPDVLKPPAGNKLYLVGHAFGTQDYVCLPSATAPSGFAYALFTPEATLLDGDDEQIIKHYFAPNPDEKNVVRAAWQHSRDSSIVFAKLFGKPFVDPPVAPGAIAWLLLEKAGVEEGPTGGDKLTKTTFVQRVNTVGGVAPPTGCASSSDVGRQAFVPYKADYFFYTSPDAQ